jgi:hypothetical protein
MDQTFTECLSKARSWLVKTNNRICRNYGLRIDHLILDKAFDVERLVRWEPDIGEVLRGYKFSIIRHPAKIKLKQRWKVFLDGSLALDYEESMTKGANIKCQGKLIHRSELWKE